MDNDMEQAASAGQDDAGRSGHRTYLNVAWVLTLVLVIWAIIVGNTPVPSWSVAIPGVVVGFWWAFGHGFVGGDRGRGDGRDRNRNRNR